MAFKINLGKRVQDSNKRTVSLRKLVRFFNRNQKIEFADGNIVFGHRYDRDSYSINVSSLNDDDLYTLLNSKVATAPGFYKFLYNSTSIKNKKDFTSQLLSRTSNHHLIADITTTKDGEPFVSALADSKTNTKRILSNLNGEQAANIINTTIKTYDNIKEKGVDVGSLDPVKDVWFNLPDSTKYNPDVFNKLIDSEGAPLITGIKKFRKYTDKNKIINVVGKHPERINEIIDVFGVRAIFSDTELVKKMTAQIYKKATKITNKVKQNEILAVLQDLRGKATDYSNEVKLLKKFTSSSHSIKTKHSNMLKSIDNRLANQKLTDIEKEFVLDSILKVNFSEFNNKDQNVVNNALQIFLDKLSTQKTFKSKKVNVNLDKVFYDTNFMKEIISKTVSAGVNYNFYYKDKNEKAENLITSAEKFSAKLIEEHSKRVEKLNKLSALDTGKTMNAIEKSQVGVLINFAGNAKLKDSKKDKIINTIKKSDFKNAKSVDSFTKLIDKNSDSIFTDKNFVEQILDTFSSTAYGRVIDGQQPQDVLNDYKGLFDMISDKYESNLAVLGQINDEVNKLNDALQNQNSKIETKTTSTSKSKSKESNNEGGLSHGK